MRVVHVIARFNQGGTATWLNNLIVGQRSMGDEVWLLAGQVDTSEKEDMSFFSLGGIRVENLMRKISLPNDIKSFFQIRRQLKDLKIDIVNTHTAKAGMIGRLAAWSLGANRPYIVHTYHGHVLYGYFGKLATLIFIYIERGLAKVTDQIFVSGIRVRDELIESGIGKSHSYLVLRPGVELPVILEKNAVRPKFGIPEDALVVGWLGRLTQIKRPDRFLEMVELVSRNDKSIKFLVAGGGDLLETCQKTASEKSLPVIFLGWRSDIENILSASDIVVLTSDNEGSPLTIIEAGQLGVPTLSRAVGGVPSLITHESTGFLTGDDPESIADALSRISTSPDILLEVSTKAKAHFLHDFSELTFLNNYKSLYSTLVR